MGGAGRAALKPGVVTEPAVRAAITKPQLAGLLSALGEYVVRAEGYQPEVMGSTYSSWDSSRIDSILLFNDRNRYKNNLAKQRDVIAEPIDPRVRITNREIRVDSGENIIHRLVSKGVRSGVEMIGTPVIHGKAGVYRLRLIEN